MSEVFIVQAEKDTKAAEILNQSMNSSKKIIKKTPSRNENIVKCVKFFIFFFLSATEEFAAASFHAEFANHQCFATVLLAPIRQQSMASGKDVQGFNIEAM